MNAYGINRPCYPSVSEIMQAEKVFTEYVHQHAHETRYTPENAFYSSPELIIKCALGRVWEAGRLYQMNLESTRRTGNVSR